MAQFLSDKMWLTSESNGILVIFLGYKKRFLHKIEQEIEKGDFIYVPSQANHQPVNSSSTENLVLIVARNAPVEIVVELEKVLLFL